MANQMEIRKEHEMKMECMFVLGISALQNGSRQSKKPNVRSQLDPERSHGLQLGFDGPFAITMAVNPES